MIRLFSIFIILTSMLLAQYSTEDIELAKTTFTQTYDKKLINEYLNSGDQKRIIAALLSISQSLDTSFLPYITKIDFNKYGAYLAFTIGQLGESKTSTAYLLNRLNEKNLPFRKEVYEALGKTGTSDTFTELLSNYTEGESSEGITLAIANFAFRNMTDSLQRDFNILSKEFLNKNNGVQRKIDALYAASRLKVPQSFLPSLTQILKEKYDGEAGIHILQYALSAIRKTGSITEDARLIKEFLNHKDWRIRTEAVKVFCFSSFNTAEDFVFYLNLLKDENPNVSRQTAISIRNIKLNNKNKQILYNGLRNYLKEMNSLTVNTAGELFISYTVLFPDELHNAIEEFQKNVNKVFIYNALELNTTSPEKKLEWLNKIKVSDMSAAASKLEIINYFSAYLAVSGLVNGKADNDILANLQYSIPPVVSILADGVDSVFIKKHGSRLKDLIIKSVNNNLNIPDFAEALISLGNLAGRIDSSFQKEVLNILLNSSLYSVVRFSSSMLNVTPPLKDLSNFSNAWNNAFKYRTAKVITGKGEFTIQFFPEYSPISVGNFCYLALTGYYTGNIFHRVVPNFVIQSGDRQGTGWGGPGYEIISEYSPLPYETGYVGMASSGKDTEGSQWFVMHSYFPHLNGRYTNFGKIIEGMDVVNAIDQGDKVIRIVPEPGR